MAICSKCGSDNMEMRNGVSKKNGQAWSGFKCIDCGNMDFIKTKKVENRAYTAPNSGISKPVTEQAKKEMLISYAKDVVVAEIAKGIEVKEPFKRIADGFKVLFMAYQYPFGKPQPQEEAPIEEMPF